MPLEIDPDEIGKERWSTFALIFAVGISLLPHYDKAGINSDLENGIWSSTKISPSDADDENFEHAASSSHITLVRLIAPSIALVWILIPIFTEWASKLYKTRSNMLLSRRRKRQQLQPHPQHREQHHQSPTEWA